MLVTPLVHKLASPFLAQPLRESEVWKVPVSDRRKAVLLCPRTPARRVLTALLEKVPLNDVMGMGVSDGGGAECFRAADELSEPLGWRSTPGSSHGPRVA